MKRYLVKGLTAVCAIAVLVPGFWHSLKNHTDPVVTRADWSLAEILESRTTPEQTVWTPWSYGFFIQYISERKTVIDGSKQTPLRFFITYFPLASKDPVLAANWIHFFTVHGIHGREGLKGLISRLGGREQAFAFLKELFADPEDAGRVLRRFGFKELQRWKRHFLPDSRAVLCLSADMIVEDGWWYYYGCWDVEKRKGTRPEVISAPAGRCELDREKARIRMNGRVYEYSRILDIHSSGFIKEEKVKQERGNVLLNLKAVDYMILIHPKIFESLLCRVMFRDPDETRQFNRVYHHPLHGGIWEINNGDRGIDGNKE